MVSRVTTALMLALAASTDAAGGAPRALLGLDGPVAKSADTARVLAAAAEVALAAAPPRRALLAASAHSTAASTIGAAQNATAPRADSFVRVSPDGTSFELDGRKFIAVGANQCAWPLEPAARRRGHLRPRQTGPRMRRVSASE